MSTTEVSREGFDCLQEKITQLQPEQIPYNSLFDTLIAQLRLQGERVLEQEAPTSAQTGLTLRRTLDSSINLTQEVFDILGRRVKTKEEQEELDT